MEGRGRDLEVQLESLRPYIVSVANRCSRRSVMYGTEDLVQEASVVLWRIVEEYPSVRGDQLLKIFRASLRNRLASIFRVPRVVRNVDESIDRNRNLFNHMVEGSPITPWTFYEKALEDLGAKMGKARLDRIVGGPRCGRQFKLERRLVKNLSDL